MLRLLRAEKSHHLTHNASRVVASSTHYHIHASLHSSAPANTANKPPSLTSKALVAAKEAPEKKQVVTGLMQHIFDVAADEQSNITQKSLYNKARQRGSSAVGSLALAKLMTLALHATHTPTNNEKNNSYPVVAVPDHLKHLSTNFFTDPTVITELRKYAIVLNGQVIITWPKVKEFLDRFMTTDPKWVHAAYGEKLKGTMLTLIEWRMMYEFSREPAPITIQGIFIDIKNFLFGIKKTPYAAFERIERFQQGLFQKPHGSDRVSYEPKVLQQNRPVAGP